MKHTVQTLTADVLVEIFGDSKDWCSVYKNGKRVGTFAELRQRVLKKQVLDDVKERKKFHDNLMKNDNIRDARRYLEENLKTAEVFLNQTQPNVHINGCKCYIICGAAPKIRMSITHATMKFDEMQQLAGINGKPNNSPNHILFDGITLEEAKDLIILLCGK